MDKDKPKLHVWNTGELLKQPGQEGQNPREKGNSSRAAGQSVLFLNWDICQFLSGLGRGTEGKRKGTCEKGEKPSSFQLCHGAWERQLEFKATE